MLIRVYRERIYWFFRQLFCDHNLVKDYEIHTDISYYRCDKCHKTWSRKDIKC